MKTIASKTTLVIPDIHNRTAIIDRLLAEVQARTQIDQIVFLGDYFDDFGDSPDIVESVAEWLVAKKETLKNATFLYGNHDIHYAYPGNNISSGFTMAKRIAINDVVGAKKGFWDSFRFHVWVDGWLLTHAGLCKSWISGLKPSCIKKFLDEAEEDARIDLFTSQRHWFWSASFLRGGMSPVGGLVWCDTREFVPVDGINQLFGHTPSHFPGSLGDDKSKAFCIDTFNNHYALICGGELTICDSKTHLPVEVGQEELPGFHETKRKD